MGNSTARKRKPRIEFPLWKRKGGTSGKPRWCKKVNGRFCYFGYVADDPHGEAALKHWGEQAEDLRRGRVPRRRDSDYVSVARLCDRFVVSKDRRLEANEITNIAVPAGDWEQLFVLVKPRRRRHLSPAQRAIVAEAGKAHRYTKTGPGLARPTAPSSESVRRRGRGGHSGDDSAFGSSS